MEKAKPFSVIVLLGYSLTVWAGMTFAPIPENETDICVFYTKNKSTTTEVFKARSENYWGIDEFGKDVTNFFYIVDRKLCQCFLVYRYINERASWSNHYKGQGLGLSGSSSAGGPTPIECAKLKENFSPVKRYLGNRCTAGAKAQTP